MDKNLNCPVCGLQAEFGLTRTGDYEQVNCPRCGQFTITNSAKTILPDRLKVGDNAVARLSHAVRSNTSSENWFSINTSNLDELLEDKLPSRQTQKLLFLNWLHDKLDDDSLGAANVNFEELLFLTAYLGTLDSNRVVRLIDNLEEEGHVNVAEKSLDGRRVSFRDKGISFLESMNAPRIEENETSSTVSPTVTEIKADCHKCGPDRNSKIHAEAEFKGREGIMTWSNSYYIVECAGCGDTNVKHEEWFSEWDEMDLDPNSGKQIMVPGIKTRYLKKIKKRRNPSWLEELDQDNLRNILLETYEAFEHGLLMLASTGSRTVIDEIMVLKVGDVGGFAKSLTQMNNDGYISRHEKKVLEVMIDVGNASAHRGHTPSERTLSKVFDVMESLVNRFFVVEGSLANIELETPSRR